MAFVPAPNIVQVEIRGTLDGEQVENRLHVNVFHTPSVADLALVANPISTTFITNWLPLLPSTLTMREIHVKSLHTQNAPEQTFPFGGGTVGGRGTPQLPNSSTICVSLRSNQTGRSARGRLYWMGLTEGDVTGNLLAAAVGTSIAAAVNATRNALVTAGFAWEIVSYITNNQPRVGGPVYFQVLNAVLVDNVVDSQRRRLPGRGR